MHGGLYSMQYVVTVKSTVKILSIFVALLENMNFTKLQIKIGVHLINVELSQLLTPEPSNKYIYLKSSTQTNKTNSKKYSF